MKKQSLLLVLLMVVGNMYCFPKTPQKNLKLPQIFQSNMVLQRNMPIKIWGWAKPQQTVLVTMGQNQVRTETSKKGEWKIVLPQLKAGGPYKIQFTTSQDTIELKNVLMGDVWICAGQSNMWWPVKQTPYKEEDTSWMKQSHIRLFTVNTEMDYMPEDDVKGTGWKNLTKENIGNFSAVGYQFGKYLQTHLDVPIGLISDNLGATSIETWMSNDALMKFPQYQKAIGTQVKRGESFNELTNDFEKIKPKWFKRYYKGKGVGEKWFLPETDTSDWKSIEVAGDTWEKDSDLKNFDGAVWFRTSFDLPENYTDSTFNIQLLQIDDYDITWVNGEKIGETYGNHNHRNYVVPTSQLKKKNNVLVVRVFDTGGMGGFTTDKFWGNSILWGKWLYKKGKEINPKKFNTPVFPNASPFSSPGVLYNANIAPITPLPIKGVVWYQGEANVDRAFEYRSLFPSLIKDWREKFQQGNFPFYFVQLANYGPEQETPEEDKWAELREAQTMALKEPNTGMAVAIDIGEAGTIHPLNKVDVGQRLGRIALNKTYGEDTIAYQGPTYKKMEIENGNARVYFNNVKKGLHTKSKYGYIRGFEIAGSDKKFYWARAYLKDNSVVVFSPQVNKPVAVRYAWSQNPGPLDLYNDSGLPAEPFRTDDWELSTKGKVFQEGPRF